MTIRPYSKLLVPVSIILILSYVPLFLPADLNALFTQEDRIFETLSAVFFLLTALLFVAAYFRAAEGHTRLKRLSYLALALCFLIFAGEEISWGQRIFDTGDSEVIRSINKQNETNIHNLQWLEDRGDDASFPLNLLYPGTMFLIFTISVWFIIPVAAALYQPAQRFFDALMPIFPWQLFLLMILNFALYFGVKAFLKTFPELYNHPTMHSDWAITEVIEHGTALILMVITANFVFVTLAPESRLGSTKLASPLRLHADES